MAWPRCADFVATRRGTLGGEHFEPVHRRSALETRRYVRKLDRLEFVNSFGFSGGVAQDAGLGTSPGPRAGEHPITTMFTEASSETSRLKKVRLVGIRAFIGVFGVLSRQAAQAKLARNLSKAVGRHRSTGSGTGRVTRPVGRDQ